MEIATKDGAQTWTFGEQHWQQTPDGHFSLQSVAATKPSASLVDLDYLVGAIAVPGSDGNQYLPSTFRFSPVTGQALPAARYQPAHRWLPPYGDGSGSRVVMSRKPASHVARKRKPLAGAFANSPFSHADSS